MNRMEIKRKRISIISYAIFLVNILVLCGFLGERGMGYFAGALEIFFLLILLTSYTMPEAIAKLIKSRMQKGQGKNAAGVLKAALVLGVIYSVAGGLFLFFSAEFMLVNFSGVSYAELALKLLIPAYILFVFVQVLRGFFQGMGTTVPTAVSKIIENIVLIGTEIIFCFILGRYGNKVSELLHNKEFEASYSGAGVSIGFIIAELFSVLFLVFVYNTNKIKLRKNLDKETIKMTESTNQVIYKLIMTMLPFMLCGILGRISIPGGLLVYRLNSVTNVEAVMGVWGAFYGKYLALVLFIVMLIRLSVVAIEERIYDSYRKDEYKHGKEWVITGSHFIILQGAFWSAVVAVLGNTFVNAFYDNNVGLAGQMLSGGSTVILFMSGAAFFINVMIAQGKIKKVILNMFIGAAIFFGYIIIGTFVFKTGIGGIVTGLCVSWLVILLCSGFVCIRNLKWKPEWIYMLVIPIGCASLTGIIVLLLNKAVSSLSGDMVSFLVCIVVALIVYCILIMAFRGIREDELDRIPGGKILSIIADKLHFL